MGRRSASAGPGDRHPAGSPGLASTEADPGQVAAWIESACRGDSSAFDRLVGVYGHLLYRVIGRMVRDPDDRDDLVQETFVRAFEALGRFRPGFEFRPWLLTIGLNAVRDHLRRRRRRPSPAPLDDEKGNSTLPSVGPAPDAVAEGEEFRKEAEAAFRRLDLDAQAILWLRVRESLQYDEIAQVLGVPRGTVMSRLARAREALRVELERGKRMP